MELWLIWYNFVFIGSIGFQIGIHLIFKVERRCGIYPLAILDDLVVQMGAGGYSRTSNGSDKIMGIERFPFGDNHGFHMPIERTEAIGMRNNNMHTVTIRVIFDMCYPSGSGTINRGIFLSGQIYPKVLFSNTVYRVAAVPVGT
jgi:hypothetical protein